ncbi:MAG: hypothetical protein ILNGONEN_01775 [Syntrophorhabdaceae bacterium]|nr:hypothetical protein [Syntrophorhabdaceae bacterium]
MRQFSYPNSQFTNILGGASIGWKLNVYDTGTTDKASIYSNLAQTTPTANPVIADADGFLASFYWTGTVDVVLTDENDNLVDSANGIQDLVSTINAVVVAGNISLPYGAASGDGNTITATLPVTSDFSDGGAFIIRANANNAGTINTPNLQINSYASRRIKKIGGSALVANDIVSGMNCLLVYHEAQDSYYLLNPNASYLNRDGTAKMLGAIDMDSHKITNLTNGTANGDAVNYLQLGGDAAREFLAATATTGSAVVNKDQFDAKTGLATTTATGIVEKATQAEMNAGTADKFPSAAEIFSGFTNSSDGFKLPEFLGGWEIKTGTSTQSFGDTDVTITFTPAFASVCAFTIGIILNSSSSDTEDIWVQIQSKNASSVTFKIQGSVTITPESRTIQWFAIGK